MPQEQDPFYAEFQKPADGAQKTATPEQQTPAAGADPFYGEFQKPAAGDPYREIPQQATIQARPETWTEYAKSLKWVPSTESTLVGGGALIGGGLGLSGGPAGAAGGGFLGGSIGESAYQLGQTAARRYPQSGLLQQLFPHEEEEPSVTERLLYNLTAGTTGMLQEYGGAKIGALGRSFEKSALRSGLRAVGAKSSTDIAAARDGLRTVIKDLPFASDLTQLTEKLAAKDLEASTKLEGMYNALPPNTKIPGSNQRIYAGLARMRDTFLVQDASGAWVPDRGAEQIVHAYEDMMKDFQGPDQTLNTLRTKRQVKDWLVNWSRREGARVPQGEQVYKDTANLIRDEINTHFPDIGRQNAIVASWKDLRSIAKAEEPLSFMGGRESPAITGVAAELALGRKPGAYATGSAVRYATGPFKTGYRTLTAPYKMRVANFLNRGDIRGALTVIATGTAAAGNAALQDYLFDRPGMLEGYGQQEKTRADFLRQMSQNPAAPVAQVSKAPSPSGSASARIGQRPAPAPAAQPAPAAAAAPTPATPMAEAQIKARTRYLGPSKPDYSYPSRTPLARGTPGEKYREDQRMKLVNPINVVDLDTGHTGQISAGAFDPKRYKLDHGEILPKGAAKHADDFIPSPQDMQIYTGGQ